MAKYSVNAVKYLSKTAIVGLMVATLVASGGEGGGGETSPLAILPGDTSGSYTETDSGDTQSVDANLTFRANSAYLSNGSYAKVSGHKVDAEYGKTETLSGFTKSAAEFSGLLISTTVAESISFGEIIFTPAQVAELNGYRDAIAALQALIALNPTSPDLLTWKQDLQANFESLADLISYNGLSISVRATGSGNGYYGLFVSKNGQDFGQLSGVFALADGQVVADYATIQAAGGTSVYGSKFEGGAVSGGQYIDLAGTGTITADFDAQQLTGNFIVSNQSNVETGELDFSGSMGVDAGGETGMIFNNDDATYTADTGLLNDMTDGNVEATLTDNGDTILGSVNFTDGDTALVGGFGGDVK